jgi:pSer/pThr/pTyr-binding forkhead associated (FHA) protein
MFTIESPVVNMMRTQTEKNVTYYESDNEDCYNAYGNAKHPLSTTCERMYTVVGKVTNYDHELQQGDIIKLGRTKFLVREINIVSQNEELKKQNERINRHRQQFTKKLLSGHITWKNYKLRKQSPLD